MFRELSKLAFPLVVLGIVSGFLADDLASLFIPLAVVGSVICVLSGVAKGFERADRNRRNRY